MITIDKAVAVDLAKILQLQKIAFLSEARLLHNFEIQPLQQNLSELEAEFQCGPMLKAWDTVDGTEEILGSVRGRLLEETLHIGKLMVHPLWQGRGLGARLLEAMENCCSDAKRYELFTSSLNQGNLTFYARHGYHEFERHDSGLGFELVYLEKGA